jgi:flagellum-specific ATP synthase
MPSIVDEGHLRLAGRIRDLLSAYRESEDLINIGAYVKGSNARIDEAIAHREPLKRFLCQDLSQSISWRSSREAMEGLFAPPS